MKTHILIIGFLVSLSLSLGLLYYLRSKKRITIKIIPTSITGNRVKGYGTASKLGYPTVNFLSAVKIPSGMYMGDSDYGKAVILINGGFLGESHYLQWNPEVDNQKQLSYFNITKIEERPNSIVEAFNRGASLRD